MADLSIKVTDIKQFIYCPRIIYYYYCMLVEVKSTDKMIQGKDFHEKLSLLEKRRKLRKYGIEKAERIFSEYIYSENLNLAGIIDLYLKTANGIYFTVDFKNSDGVGLNHKCQLMGYTLLLEEKYKVRINEP